MGERSPRPEEKGHSGVHVSSVYVHAPFCPRRCVYCDFAVTVARTADLKGWLDALAAELRNLKAEGAASLAPELDTLFVGGGTPSTLGPDAMVGLARILGLERLAAPSLEWTVEANPESFTAAVAEGWARAGVNRISLGAQSFQEGPLRWLGRLHGGDGPSRAVDRAREAGITNLSLDLIFGLPREVERDWEADLDAAMALGVPHLSLYGLSVEPGTPLGRWVVEGIVSGVDEDRFREEFLLASDRLTRAGYRQYELSNFALPGLECRHNQVYWGYQPYLGLGNSAHSFLPPVRRWNLRDWPEYQGAARAGRKLLAGEELLHEPAIRLERIWLGLRTAEGIELDGLGSGARAEVARWVRKGWARDVDGRARLTPEGWIILDDLAVRLAHAQDMGAAPP